MENLKTRISALTERSGLEDKRGHITVIYVLSPHRADAQELVPSVGEWRDKLLRVGDESTWCSIKIELETARLRRTDFAVAMLA